MSEMEEKLHLLKAALQETQEEAAKFESEADERKAENAALQQNKEKVKKNLQNLEKEYNQVRRLFYPEPKGGKSRYMERLIRREN